MVNEMEVENSSSTCELTQTDNLLIVTVVLIQTDDLVIIVVAVLIVHLWRQICLMN